MAELQWTQPPAMEIDASKSYMATLQTEKGDIIIDLFAKTTPFTVNNFVFLARQGFYNGTIFHRVITDFMVQGGDPTGTGMGGPGYHFGDEFAPGLHHDKSGILSMANAGPGTNGSQFFITHVPTPWLDNKHTIFGEVIKGLEVVLSIPARDPQQRNSPAVKILEAVISEE